VYYYELYSTVYGAGRRLLVIYCIYQTVVFTDPAPTKVAQKRATDTSPHTPQKQHGDPHRQMTDVESLAPAKRGSRRKCDQDHHTIFVVDTSLTRQSRILKPSLKLRDSAASPKQGLGLKVKNLSESELYAFLYCNEDNAFMFEPIQDARDEHFPDPKPLDPDSMYRACGMTMDDIDLACRAICLTTPLVQ
jgi:hypothetical protein